MQPAPMPSDAISNALAIRDLTDPAEGFHAMQLLVEDAEVVLRNTSRCRALVHRGGRVAEVSDHFDGLRYPADHPERHPSRACYIDSSSLFRRHTTAALPPLLRRLSASLPRDILLLLPGIVYQHDCAALSEAHELDLWRLRSGRSFSVENSESMIDCVMVALLPHHRYRFVDGAQPHLRRAVRLEVLDGNRWIEVGESGLARPDVLEMCGVPPEIFACSLRLALDRVLMLRKGIDDAQLLRSKDPAIANRMRDLAPYHSAVDRLSTTTGSFCSSRCGLPSNSM